MGFARNVVVAASLGLMLTAGSGSMAQQPASLPAPPANSSGWIFNVAPYLWLPQINVGVRYDLPPQLGGKLPTDVTTHPGDYLPNLNFAAMVAADAQYGRFSVLTDFIYMNVRGAGTDIKSLDFFGLPSQPISRSLQTSTSSTLKATLWTAAGGYTVASGDWGNFDVLAGFRYLGINANTDYSLAFTVVGPRGNGATFGGVGGISGSTAIWNGIGGFRGRIRLPVEGLFIPYYFDIGAGGSNLTWQVATGLGYQTGWAGVSALYRYLSFEQGNDSFLRHINLGGPMVMVNFTF